MTDEMKAHPLVGKAVRWTHGPNVLVGPATHYDDEDDELFIVPDGLAHGHYWVPASECSPLAALSPLPDEQLDDIEKRAASANERLEDLLTERIVARCNDHQVQVSRLVARNLAVEAMRVVNDDQRAFLAEVRRLRTERPKLDGREVFEALADRLGEHERAGNHEIADSGEYETKLKGTFDVEDLAAFLTPVVLALSSHPDEETEYGWRSFFDNGEEYEWLECASREEAERQAREYQIEEDRSDPSGAGHLTYSVWERTKAKAGPWRPVRPTPEGSGA